MKSLATLLSSVTERITYLRNNSDVAIQLHLENLITTYGIERVEKIFNKLNKEKN